MRELLLFEWPHASPGFSFDIGGCFRGDGLDNQSFLVEVKNHRKENSLPTEYRSFLAKCYVAYRSAPQRCDHFIWLSWAPFQAQKWDVHTSAVTLQAALLHEANRERVFGVSDVEAARAQIDPDALAAVAGRLWLLTLCDKQENLVLTREHYLQVLNMIIAEAV